MMLLIFQVTHGKLNMWLRRLLSLTSVLCVHQFAFADNLGGDKPAPYEQCEFCHEYDGNSFAGNYPKIAGMKQQYLLNQLRDYKLGRRNGDGKMQEAAMLLSDEDMQIVVDYFSEQQRSPASAWQAGTDYSHARTLATKGDPGRQLIACNVCHESSEPYIPRLKDQHAKYIAQELFAYKNKTRTNDVASIMRFLAERLSNTEITQLSQYLATGGKTQ
jgi:cytochrome c553